MLATITKVGIETAPKGYKVAVVDYLKDGKPENRKIMSFAAPDAFKTLSEMKDFPVEVNIKMEKKGQFWNWTGIEVGGAKTDAPKVPATTGKVLGSNYETPQERARRQVYIVRQSSIANAIDYLSANQPKGITASVNEVIETAKVFEQYVFSTEVEQPAEPQ